MSVTAGSPLTTFSVDMSFDDEKMPQALELLLGGVEPIRVKPGCASCRVQRDVADRRLVHYTEEWTSAGAFRRHVRSREFWRVLVAMDLAAEEPAVTLGDMAVRRGIGLLSELRSEPGPGGDGTEPRRGKEE
ncbi:MAG TPA: antibiotic biosynthesis monooxygenase [Thermoanaerobaculia bacterium]|nr:antibiotic biosynthesis monooxygenase [Thermoanaerobaculia bacterium]HQR65856.1 antibiotic biosynthesis monooxygenase [Thermoanaerobaculia bacterium]